MTASHPGERGDSSWWRRWLIEPVMIQLKQGMSPEKLGWTISAGMVLGIFPIMGTTSLICFLVAWLLKMNQAVIHVFSGLVYPLHLALILVFIRIGERIHGAPMIPFSIPQLVVRFKESPAKFAADFGQAAWHGVVAWALFAPFLAYGIKLAVTPFLKKWSLLGMKAD